MPVVQQTKRINQRIRRRQATAALPTARSPAAVPVVAPLQYLRFQQLYFYLYLYTYNNILLAIADAAGGAAAGEAEAAALLRPGPLVRVADALRHARGRHALPRL